MVKKQMYEGQMTGEGKFPPQTHNLSHSSTPYVNINLGKLHLLPLQYGINAYISQM